MFAVAAWRFAVASARSAWLTAAWSAEITVSGRLAAWSDASRFFASVRTAWACEMASRPDAAVCDCAVFACESARFACVTDSFAFAFALAVTGFESAARRAFAAARLRLAVSSALWASAVSAVARTAPSTTGSPSLTLTVWTVHCWAAAAPPVPVADTFGLRVGACPNASA